MIDSLSHTRPAMSYNELGRHITAFRRRCNHLQHVRSGECGLTMTYQGLKAFMPFMYSPWVPSLLFVALTS